MQVAAPHPARISEILLICGGLIIALILLADALAGSAPPVLSAAALPTPALHLSLRVAVVATPPLSAINRVARLAHRAPVAQRAPTPPPAVAHITLSVSTPVTQLPRPHIITAGISHLAAASITPTLTLAPTIIAAKLQPVTAIVPAATPTRRPTSAAATKPVRTASPSPPITRVTATPAAILPPPTVDVPQPTVVTAPLRSPADDETRNAIVAMLTRRQQAVMSSDGDSFIDTVDPSDDTLRNEQTTWFEALRDRPPSYYTLELGSLSLNLRRDRATGLLTERTKLGSNSHEVKTEVVFVKRGDNWYYADLNFQTLTTPNFRIRFFANNRAVGNALYKAADRTYAQITADLGTAPIGVSEVKLYPSTALLQNSVMLSLPQWVGGWSMPGQSIKTAYNGVATAAYINLMAHEFTHQCAASFGLNRANSPDWLNEGLAVYEAERIAPFSYEVNTRAALLRKALANNNLFDWNDYPSFAQVTGGQVSLAYEQAYSAVQYLIEKYGRAQFNQMLANLVAGSSPDEAFTLAFNTTLADFDSAWRAWLSVKYK